MSRLLITIVGSQWFLDLLPNQALAAQASQDLVSQKIQEPLALDANLVGVKLLSSLCIGPASLG